jgi:hypothetical protein
VMFLFFVLLVLGIIAAICGFFLPVQQPVRKALTIIAIALFVASIAVLIFGVTQRSSEPVPVTPVVDCNVSETC